MITQGMSAQEVWDHMASKLTELNPILMSTQTRVRKKLRKLPPRQMGGEAIPYRFKQLNQDLLLVIGKTDQNTYGSCAMAVVPYHNGKLFYNFSSWDTESYMEVYTSHYFRRYQERTHSRHSYPTIVAQYMARTLIASLLYLDFDNGRAVYAIPDGLSLCTLDKDKWLIIHRTFVSAEMLKTSQREAYAIYLEHQDDIMHFTNKAFRKKWKHAKDFYHSVEDAPLNNLREIAGKIYAQYWEEDDNTD